MEQRIIHVCGHEQAHYLTGFASQQDRKAKWLKTTKCRICFVAEKRQDQASAAERDQAAIAHLDLPLLCGSDRQVAWATTIRASRLAALGCDESASVSADLSAYAAVTDAKWWIDHRSLSDLELLSSVPPVSASPVPQTGITPTAGVPRAA